MPSDARTYRIVVLPGDGIGPEVTDEAVRVLRAAAVCGGFEVEIVSHPIGGAALDRGMAVLPEETLNASMEADAVFLGAVGGPRWDGVAPDQRPERALLGLRKALNVYANLRPVSVPEGVGAASPLRPELVQGVDLLVVRELTGGIYFGPDYSTRDDSGQTSESGSTMVYTRSEVERVARVAFDLAGRRRSKVTSVDKANVLAVSRLWREVVIAVHQAEFPEIELEHMYVDNAAMQLVRNPRQFDVILTGNLFGDILSDLAATLPGSLGMLPSASVGGRTGLFEPVHGSAPDIAGQSRANPVGAILSVAMMLEHLGQDGSAAEVRKAVAHVLASGLRTGDVATEGSRLATTVEFGAAVAGEIAGSNGSRNGHNKKHHQPLSS